jgi:hypothetical protein
VIATIVLFDSDHRSPQPRSEQRLLAASSVCVREGFWLPLAAQVAELNEHDAVLATGAEGHT